MTETLDELIAAMSQARGTQVFGGTGQVKAKQPISIETAKAILFSLLHWDQAYVDNPQMDAEQAIDLTERFFALFDEREMQCFTNGRYDSMNGRHEFIRNGVLYTFMMERDGASFDDVSNATFSGGIYVVTPALSAYCVIEDED